MPANPDIHLYWPLIPGASDYWIYRSPIFTFVHGPLNFIGATVDTFFADPGIIADPGLSDFSKVVAHRRANGCR